MALWMVRTSQNLIAGPYPEEQVKDLILSGKLDVQDEICAANGYWIQLHERDEVKRQLGVEVPLATESSDEEATQTDTETETETESQTDARESASVSASGSMMLNRGGSPHRVQPPLILGQIERPSIWRGFAWLLVLGIALTVYAVLRMIRSG